MEKRTYILLLFAAAIMLASCEKKDDLSKTIVGLGGDTWVKTPIDNWIFDNLTNPYNIEVKYKWDRSELNLNKDLVPVSEDKVIPAMDAIKKTWIDPYTSVAGDAFVKKYSHKQFVLVGSLEYNSNNTVTLGTAEGGRKIVLYEMNNFSITNKPIVRRILHTIHHEFGHILNQNILVTSDYKRITPAFYTSTWFNYTDAEARALGFITSYSRSNTDDDFVEMLSTLLVDGSASFNNIVNNQFNTETNGFIKRDGKGIYEKNTFARNALTQKQQIVVSYLKSAFGIDLATLQNKTQEAIEGLAPTADFNSLLGPGKTYTTVTINPQKTLGQSAKFLTAFNTANAKLQTDKFYYIDDIVLFFTAANKLTLRVRFLSPSSTTPQTVFSGDFDYSITNTNGQITLTYLATQPTTTTYTNARAIEASIPALLAYFNGQQFNVKWVDDIVPQSKGLFGGFVKPADPISYLFGTIN